LSTVFGLTPSVSETCGLVLPLDDEQEDLPLAVCQPLEGVYLPETRYSVVSIEVKGSLE
jgi:hypothetical protein